MSTDDCPGANPANHDELAMGAWAEADKGQSLIFVKSTEQNRVIYEVYDLSHEPVLQYTDTMVTEDFKKNFTWEPSAKRGLRTIRWTWHDKTPFPWDKVIKAGARDGARFASAEDEIANAKKIQASRKRLAKGKKLNLEKRDPVTGVPLEEDDGVVAAADANEDESGESAAAQVAKQRHLEGKPFDPKMHEHKVEQVVGKTGVGIFKRIQNAIDALKGK